MTGISNPSFEIVNKLESVTETLIKDPKRQIWRYRPQDIAGGSVSETRAPTGANFFTLQQSEKNKKLLAAIERATCRSHSILITGETGTGKTFTARQIHAQSARSNKPFVELNCASFPESLVEAELFGYRKGAFTGADRDHKGLFEEASGGILFLDEIGDMPLIVQTKLLKAIEEKKIKRLGTNYYIECDVQVIAATSRDLLEMIRCGNFREDLYHRLAVLAIEVIPLRERHEDIPWMIDYYLREAVNTVTGPESRALDREASFKIECGAVELLCEYDYPGNIRALKNLIYRLTTYVQPDKPITIELVQETLAKLRQDDQVSVKATIQKNKEMSSSESGHIDVTADLEHFISGYKHDSSMVEEGDIVLPFEICVIRRGETYKQWSLRIKRRSIEAASNAAGDTLETVARRLGMTIDSLKAHLYRSKITKHWGTK